MEKKRAIKITALLWQIVADKGCRKGEALRALYADGRITAYEHYTITKAHNCPLCAYVIAQKGTCKICPGNDLWIKGQLISKCDSLCEKYALSPWVLYLNNIDSKESKVHAQQIADWAAKWCGEKV